MFKLIISLFLIIILYFSLQNSYYHGPKSNHFDGKKFFDPQTQYPNNFLDFLKWQFTRNKTAWPKKIDLQRQDIPPQRVLNNKIRISNIGHFSFLIQVDGINILTDPIWSKRASPLSFLGPKRVIDPGIKFNNLPKIDIVLISHNHYDHLDLATIEKLWNKHKPLIITPLGNDAIIKKHNNKIIVKAYDWGETVNISKKLNITLEPTQHWSARGLFDTNHALWSAYVIQSKSCGNIYFSGDTGYSPYFLKTKQKYKKINFAILPIGAYKPRWFMKYAHMSPKDAIKAYMDLGQPLTFPAHYDVFPLADEKYGEAITTLNKQLKKLPNHKFKALSIGEFGEF